MQVLEKLDESQAQSIRTAKEAMHQKGVSASLAFISANFRHLPVCITQLERWGVPMTEAFAVIERCISENIEGTVGSTYHAKMQAVLARNPGYEIIQTIVDILRGERISKTLPWEPATVASMKFAPITSCDVERSFSAYKLLLRDNRKKFTPENIEKHMIVYCFNKQVL